MVTAWIVLGLLTVLLIAVVYDTRRRRGILEANLPADLTRAARRAILREQRAQNRAAQARYIADHPYLHGGGNTGGL